MTEPADTTAERASFGYRDVPASEKAGMVARVFASVAPRYDLMNDLMSGGVHRLWKNALIDVLNPRAGESSSMSQAARATSPSASCRRSATLPT